MIVHEMKINARWFDDVASGAKNFEIRKNDRDGGFTKGDILVLKEIEKNGNGVPYYTGRAVAAKVAYVLTEADFPEGIRKGYAILGLGKAVVLE